MQKKAQEIWEEALPLLKSKLGPRSYETWFHGTRGIALREGAITVAVPNKFCKDWIEDKYGPIVKEVIEKAGSEEMEVQFVVEAGGGVVVSEEKLEERKDALIVEEKKMEAPRKGENLNPRYTFDSFVVGPSNRFAHAASLAVAESPARSYNPLFIYGGVGLGKTHLMQAIGQFLLKKNRDAKILYISSERFTNQLITAIQNRTTLAFREKYRNLEVLLIDDIHFIAGKEATQEEFFHTFNALYDAHKQIVLSSDRSPKEIQGLEERLVSRFEWGLITDIQKPDLETRIAILRKKSETDRLSAPDEVTTFIAEKVTSNIRELEGALMRVVAYSSIFEKEITLDLAKDILKEMLLEEEKKITVDLIQKKVAAYFDIRLQDMKVKRRSKAIAYPRQVAMYLVRELTEHSLPEIGEFFGGRDHTTVLHAYSRIRGEMEKNESTRSLIHKLILEIKA
ncbi:MAG: chromosomal replication initiator protein DnaA [Candidatus Omnitrophica bacterium]|nr:chromosomal replication initiator protein DnaA [Candidatus Omnitrophota bacterium]